MRALQWKSSGVVIEGRRLPGARRVAARARVRKIRRGMIGICRALKITLMARETIRRRAGELIVHMALAAHHGEMRAGERKARAVVVEIGRPPGIKRVAHLAIVREIAGDMVWIRRSLKIHLVTGETIFRCSCELAVNMTLSTLDRAMRSDQRKSRAIMVEARRLPGVIVMANLAIL